MPNATGTFEVTPGSEDALFETDDGLTLTHATGIQRFTGDIQGEGSVDWLMCYLPNKTARFVGLQRIDGSLDGRTGTFVMEATGSHDGTQSGATWTIVSGSGTGDLTGITGEGSFDAAGGRTVTYVLEYRLE
jgi:uncharacterized protein DUF3224